jgi:hypothetical protein
MSVHRRTAATIVIVSGLIVGAGPGRAEPPEMSAGGPAVLTELRTIDIEAKGRLFERGIPVAEESFSPDGYYFTYLHHVPGGFLRRKPERRAFLLDLGTGDNRPTKTSQGRAARLGGWDSSGRYFLLETVKPDFLFALTGDWHTYHWIYDVVTSQFIPRKPFTGRRDGRRFRWKQKGAYHGTWSGQEEAAVWPLYDGELAEIRKSRESLLIHEDERRLALARRLAVGSGATSPRELGELLGRLDAHWTQRGQRDPVVSELFGERPELYLRVGDEWILVHDEIEYVAVLDRSLVLITGQGGAQSILDADHIELAPLPAPPPEFARLLQERWDRSGGFYDELDPLPRDLQYRRSFDVGQGVGFYYNYVVPDRSRVLVLYSMSPIHRVLRIVQLPESWRPAG